MISAVVLTHNDETVLERCLLSIAWCDEIVVVDDESTDGTVEIAKRSGANVYRRKLNDDFAAQRNFGLEKAKGPASTRGGSSTRGGEWVLFVDSDEEVSPELAAEIASSSASWRTPRNDNLKGYYIKRKDFFLGKWLEHGETGNIRLLRLARKNTGAWREPVHEVWDVKGPVGEMTHPILHYPHPSVAQFLGQINYYSTLRAKYLYSQKVRPSLWQILVYPKAKFLVNYFFRLGFYDGTAGFIVAMMMSFHSFLVRVKLYALTFYTKDTRTM